MISRKSYPSRGGTHSSSVVGRCLLVDEPAGGIVVDGMGWANEALVGGLLRSISGGSGTCTTVVRREEGRKNWEGENV